MKKVKVKKRIKIKSIIIALICILIVGLIVYYLLESHIKNIYVSGNNLVSEQKIIDTIKAKAMSKYQIRLRVEQRLINWVGVSEKEEEED